MNKYHNKGASMFGINFRSKAEQQCAMYLQSELQAKKILQWTYEVPYRIQIEGIHICDIIPDFTVWAQGGSKEIFEVKGGRATMTPEWRLKRKLFMALYPEIKYKVVTGSGKEIVMR